MIKRPIKEVYGSDACEASKANSIASQIELLEEIIKAKGKFDFTAELKKTQRRTHGSGWNAC
ncbi:hypothetical protein F2Q69_00041345 [Brassica cretica]|uniref:Uncharacterized protein n=1 Tax=Brassica cretica TaxID=69181 RepID=A0A8S9NNI7_BRACR|nr:hypothetical protein F2Q69_00041345 [Brassica cretica]